MSIVDPHSFAKLDQGKISHIDFKFDVDFATRTIEGKAEYRLDQPVNGSLFLDSRGVEVTKVHHNGRDIAWELDESDSILGQRLHLKGLEGVTSLGMEFKTSPNSTALQWLDPDQTAGGKYPYLYSQCQAIHARSIFPCQDTPSVRFTFTAEVSVPSPLIAVMAAAQVAVQKDAGVTSCQFDMPQPIPSYLFALAVGNLESRDLGSRCRIYAEPEVIEEGAWEFSETEEKLLIAEKMFGPYVWDRYDMLLMPPSFPYGGMENPRLSFLTPTLITGDRSLTNTVTHELAHSWTGNLVTNATWEDFWLNEGWTMYTQFRIDEVMEGSDFVHLKNALGRESMFEAMQRFGMDSHLTALKSPLKGVDPDATFSTIPYYKGVAFLTALEQVVGREMFDPFVRKYISTYHFKSLTTEEFLAFLEQELPDAISQMDIKTWIYSPGFPEDAPPIRSKLLDEVYAQIEAYNDGVLPERADISEWSSDQIHLFLRKLQPPISVQDCEYFEKLFGLKDSRNYSLQYIFLPLAIRSGYQDVLQRVEQFVAKVGRGLYLGRLFRALVETEWTRDLARPMFERFRDRHHPITIVIIEQILARHGL
jgi:leukotriene-A4 hydrolase